MDENGCVSQHLKPRNNSGLVRPHDIQHWSPDQVARALGDVFEGKREYLGQEPEPINNILQKRLAQIEQAQSTVQQRRKPMLDWLVSYWDDRPKPKGYRSVYSFCQAVLVVSRSKDIAPYLILDSIAKNLRFIAVPMPAYMKGIEKKMFRENEHESFTDWERRVAG